MADYIPITEGQSDPEAPVDSSLIKRLRDNPIAIAEGAAGAPRIYGRAAMLFDEVKATYPLTGVGVTGDLFDVGQSFPGFFGIDGQNTNTSFILWGGEGEAELSGTVRFVGSILNFSGSTSGTAELRFVKNGTVVQTFSAARNANTTFTLDVAVDFGDIVRWEARTTSSGSYRVATTSPQANDRYEFLSLIARRSDL